MLYLKPDLRLIDNWFGWPGVKCIILHSAPIMLIGNSLSTAAFPRFTEKPNLG